MGDVVFFFRDGRRKNDRERGPSHLIRSWHGPVVVVGTEPSAIYLSYEGKATKCAPEAVRKASPDEALGMSIKEQLEAMEQALFNDLPLEDAQDARPAAGEDQEARPEEQDGEQELPEEPQQAAEDHGEAEDAEMGEQVAPVQ